MEIFEALEYLGFSRYEEISIQALKKRYRKLSKKSHPDLGGNPEEFRIITESKDKLEKYLKELEILKRLYTVNKERTAIISLSDLIGMYNGKTITLSDGYVLTASNLKLNRIYIVIQYSIAIDGIQFIKEQTVPYKIDDRYQLFCEISDSNIGINRDLRVMIHNKDIQCTIGSSTKIINININNLVHIALQIERIQKDRKRG